MGEGRFRFGRVLCGVRTWAVWVGTGGSGLTWLQDPRTRAGIHKKSYSQSQTQTYTQSQTQTQPYVSINSNLVFSCKILRKYMLKLKFESEIELRNILANQIP